jgi:hypothetical protein
MAKGTPKNEPYSPTLDRIGQSKKREERTISWETCDAAAAYALIVAVNDARGSVLFGATRDRGAWAVTIFHDGLPNKKVTEYCNSEEMLDSWLAGLAEIWMDVGAELAGSKPK